MTNFEKLVQDIQKRSVATLIFKEKEYASTSDRFHNFKQAAYMQKLTAEQALLGMAAKHFVSIFDMVRDQETYSEQMWDEKIGDAINYLILLRGLVEETGRLQKANIKPVIEKIEISAE